MFGRVSWLVGWLAGRLAGWLAGWLLNSSRILQAKTAVCGRKGLLASRSLVGRLAGWPGSRLAGWPAVRLEGWMAGRPQNAYRWRFLNKNLRFMQVLSWFFNAIRGWGFSEAKNMRKIAIKCNKLIKSGQRSAF